VTLRIRERPEDFVVEELALYAPCGEGEHTFVRVEKRLRTTEDVARSLARAAGVRPGDVGYAGRKDRVAVARQWFSVPGLAPELARALAEPGWRVLEAARHRHKLRVGQLRGNRFEIAIPGVTPDAAARARAALERAQRTGFENRFGPQRFGRAGANAGEGAAILRGERAPRDRRAARFLLSALQAAAFNDALAARPIPIDRLETGDVAVVHASGGLFRVDDAAREQARADVFEISATGPVFGGASRDPLPAGAPAEREAAALAAQGVPPPSAWRLPRGLRLRGARRALRARVAEASIETDRERLLLRCVLPPGSYATVLLASLFGGPVDDSASAEGVD
jgi:tRNA pseudouridine13 synthase